MIYFYLTVCVVFCIHLQYMIGYLRTSLVLTLSKFIFFLENIIFAMTIVFEQNDLP